VGEGNIAAATESYNLIKAKMAERAQQHA